MVRTVAADFDIDRVIGGNDISELGGFAADGIVIGIGKENAIVAVGNRAIALGIQPDEIAADLIMRRVADDDSMQAIAGK